MGISVYPPASGGITTRTLKQQIFNASGTWTYPTSSKFDGTVFVTAVGGGGAGGGVRVGQGTGPWYFTGGGGGGRVLLDKEINVLNGGNQTVTIGNGGVSNSTTGFGESNGGYTIFGNPTIGNYYPDPNLRRGLGNMSTNSTYSSNYINTTLTTHLQWNQPYGVSSTSVGSGPKTGSNSSEFCTLSSNNNYTLYFDVPSSTAMRLHFRYVPNGTSGTVTPNVHWYDSNNVYISQTACTSYTPAASGTTFTLYSDTTSLTSPSTAKYAMIRFNGAFGGVTDICVSPSTAGLTAPVSGNSTDWTWAGSPENSQTVKSSGTNLANFLIAQGGSSGWGGVRTSNGDGFFRCTGSAGWSGGGHAAQDPGGSSTPVDTMMWHFGGHGGGDADSAEMPNVFGHYSGTTVLTAEMQTGGTLGYARFSNRYYSGFATGDYFRPFHSGGSGSASGRFKTAAANLFTLSDFGRPGNSTSGYGAGGTGGWYSAGASVDTTFPISRGTGTRTFYSEANGTRDAIEANTGNGGAGITVGSSESNGQNGSSGLVIVRWYE